MSQFKTYSSILILTLIALFLVKQLNISYPITLTTRTASGELSVVGEGKVEAPSDAAQVEAGILAEGETVNSVEQKINDVNNKILSALKNLGIPKQDIKTSNYSINPSYNYEAGTNRITGFNGNATLSIKVKKVEQLSQVISVATDAGANQIYATRFEIENPQKYREKARNLAIENAKEQAKKLANTLGVRLGKIVNIIESSPGGPVPFIQNERLGGSLGRASVPEISAGTQTITSTVTLYFERL